MNGLIFDIGANNGDDSAYYLRRGFRVVAIEANTAMVEVLRKRFSNELRSGLFELLPCGIAAEEGQSDFWVCDDNPDWSSFDRSTASRNGARHHKESVKTRTFASIVREYGVPYYCKIDIEGNDRLCLQDMQPGSLPTYLSIEMSHSEGDADLRLLKQLGYSKFKIISQVARSQPIAFLKAINFRVGRHLRELLVRLDRRLRGTAKEGDWYFPFGSSGPFGQLTPGPWRDYETTLTLWQRLHDLDAKYSAGGLGDWYDVHVAL